MTIAAIDVKPNVVYHRGQRLSGETPRLMLFLPRSPGEEGLLEGINFEEAEIIAEVSGGELRYITGKVNVEKYPLQEAEPDIARAFMNTVRRQVAAAMGTRR